MHSHCKVPLSISEDSTCHISQQDSVDTLFRQASRLVIDEVTMVIATYVKPLTELKSGRMIACLVD